MQAGFLSIGVNAFNEANSVARMLDSVFKSTLWKATPKEQRELVFYADGCTDGTAGIVRKMQAGHPEIRLIEEKERKGFAHARNTLANEMSSKADVLFFFDADIILQRNTMEALKRALGAHKDIDAAAAELVPAAKFKPKEERGMFARLSVTRYERRLEKNFKLINGAGYAVRSNVIRKIHLPEELQGAVDLFLTHKIGLARIMRVKEAPLVFRDPTSLNDYRKKSQRFHFARRQMKELLPDAAMPQLKVSEQARIFRNLPFDQKIAAAAIRAAQLVGRAQARLAWRRYKKGKRVNAWAKTRTDKPKQKRVR